MTLSEAPPPQAVAAQVSDDGPSLLLCCLSRGTGRKLGTTLATQPGIVAMDGLKELAAALQEQSDARALVLYDGALQTMAHVGDQPTTVLANWADQARAVLALQSRNRRRFALVNTRTVQLYPDVFVARLKLPAVCSSALAALPRPEIDPVVRSLSQIALQKDPEARRLAATLRAASIDLSNNMPEVEHELDLAFSRYRQLRSQLSEMQVEAERQLLNETQLLQEAEALRRNTQTLEEKLAKSKISRDKDRDKQDRLRDEYKATTARNAELEDALATLTRDIEGKDSELIRLRRINADVITERDGLRTRLSDIQTDLETQYQRHHAASTDLEEARQNLALLKAEGLAKQAEIDARRKEQVDLETRLKDTEHWLQGILTSRSYRVMAPLRRLRAAFKSKY